MAIPGESALESLKLLRLPSESIREETSVPTTPVGVPLSSEMAVSSGLADAFRVGASLTLTTADVALDATLSAVP